MFAVSHMAVGGTIGRRIRYPWLALPVAFLSHFALDGIPHVDLGSIYAGTTPPLGVGALTGAVLVVVVVLFLRIPGNRLPMVLGMVAGILPDWLGALGRAYPAVDEWSWMRGLMWLHSVHHPSLPWSGWPLGLSTQVVAVLLAFPVARCRSRKSGLSTT